jgi:hypothetical protein
VKVIKSSNDDDDFGPSTSQKGRKWVSDSYVNIDDDDVDDRCTKMMK